MTATASTGDKLDMLLGMPSGATHAVNYKTQDFAAEVKATTGGKGVDVVIDFVGQSHWAKNIDALAYDGRMTMLALLSGKPPIFRGAGGSALTRALSIGAVVPQFDLRPLLYKRLRVQGSTLRARSEDYQAELIARFQREAFVHLSGSEGDGKIRTYIHKVRLWLRAPPMRRALLTRSVRCTLGHRSRTRTVRWKQTRTGASPKHTSLFLPVC